MTTTALARKEPLVLLGLTLLVLGWSVINPHGMATWWLEVLPVNCELMSQPGGGYRCGSNHYRPYQQDGREIYIQGDPAGVTPGQPLSHPMKKAP